MILKGILFPPIKCTTCGYEPKLPPLPGSSQDVSLERIWRSYEWMIKTLVWNHEQTGVEQSQELKEAVDLGNDIKKIVEGK
jgi:hypothetical protein